MSSEALTQESSVSSAFSNQASGFDESDTKNEILQWMRSKVREHVMRLWRPGERILELNAGTGLDALFFAVKGFNVFATDNAPGMLSLMEEKVNMAHLQYKITVQQCSFLELEKLKGNQFDHIFSNFGGLNCTDKLDQVINSFSPILKPGGTVTLVIMPKVCPWEMLFALKGNFKLAFRRFKRGGAPAHLEGVNFTTWYYSPKEVKKMFGNRYSMVSVVGLGITVPPPFMEDFPSKHPHLYKKLIAIEESISEKAPFNAWADHFIITAKKLA